MADIYVANDDFAQFQADRFEQRANQQVADAWEQQARAAVPSLVQAQQASQDAARADDWERGAWQTVASAPATPPPPPPAEPAVSAETAPPPVSDAPASPTFDEASLRAPQPQTDAPRPVSTLPSEPARPATGAPENGWTTAFGFNKPYGAAQFNPNIANHRGVDIQVTGKPNGGEGTPYTAFQPGKVVAVTNDPAGGNGVIVQTPDGLYNRYFHNEAVLVKVGDEVGPNTPIARLGQSGSEGFPHVHYEVSRGINGDPQNALIDPTPYMQGETGGGQYTSTGQYGPDAQTSVPTTAALSGGGASGGMTDRARGILSSAAQTASWLGDDGARALQAILVTEGGMNNARGDAGRSAGPLQFFEGGQLANYAKSNGLTLDQAKQAVEADPAGAVRWAIGTPDAPGYLGLALARGQALGLSGAALATYAQKFGQVSESPERAGANYSALFGATGTQPPITAPVVAQATDATNPLGDTFQALGTGVRGAVDAVGGAKDAATGAVGQMASDGLDAIRAPFSDALRGIGMASGQAVGRAAEGAGAIGGMAGLANEGLRANVPGYAGATDALGTGLEATGKALEFVSLPNNTGRLWAGADQMAKGYDANAEAELAWINAGIAQGTADPADYQRADELTRLLNAQSGADTGVPYGQRVQQAADQNPDLAKYTGVLNLAAGLVAAGIAPSAAAGVARNVIAGAVEPGNVAGNAAFRLAEEALKGTRAVGQALGETMGASPRAGTATPPGSSPGLSLGTGAFPAQRTASGALSGAIAGSLETDPDNSSQFRPAPIEKTLGGAAIGALGVNLPLGRLLGRADEAAGAVARLGSGVAPEAVRAAAADADKILAERAAVRAGAGRTPDAAPEVQRVLSGALVNLAENVPDRRAKLAAVERTIEKLTGQPLSLQQQVWLRSRVYEGRQDVALATLEQNLGPALKGLDTEGRTTLDAFLEQMDNVNKGAAAGRKVESAIIDSDPARIAGQAALERAQASLRQRERMFQLAASGGDETAAQTAERQFRSAERVVARAQEKLDLATAAAREAQATRAGVKGAEAAKERAFSGGATLQSEDAIRQAWTDRLGPEAANDLFQRADQVWKTTSVLRDRLRSAGLISDEAAAAMERNFPYYTPSRILDHMSDAALDSMPPGGKTMSVGSSGVQGLTVKGTTKVRQSPLEAVVDMGARVEELAQRNTIMQALDSWADVPGMENFIRRIGPDAAVPKGWQPLSVFKDGTKERLMVVDELKDAVKLSGDTNGLIATMLRAASQPLRAGATGLKPAFIATNMVNDAVWTLYRFAVEAPDPVEGVRAISDFARGYRAILSAGQGGHVTGGAIGSVLGATQGDTNEDRLRNAAIGFGAGYSGAAGLGKAFGAEDRALITRARLSGASIGTPYRFTDPASIVKQLSGERVWVRQITTTQGALQLLKDVAGATGDVAGMAWSRPLNVVGSRIERAPRLAAFARAERQGANSLEAANASRRATVDFAAGGTFTKGLNAAIPFLNAVTQGATEFVSLAQRRPAQSAAALATIMGSVIATEVYNRSVSVEDTRNVSRVVGDSGLYLLSDTAPPEGQKRGLVYMPVRGGIGAMIPLVREVLGRALGDSPRTWQEIAKQMFGAISPVDADVAGLPIPPIPKLIGELGANYNTFRDQPIVPKSLQGQPVTEQYTPGTSQTARALSRSGIPGLNNQPPVGIDYALRGFSPGPAEALLGASDAVIRAAGAEQPTIGKPTVPGARDTPLLGSIVGRFLRTTGNETQTKAYDAADRIMEERTRVVTDSVLNSPAYKAAASNPDRQRQLLSAAQTAMKEQALEQAGVTQKERDYGLPPKYIGVSDFQQQVKIDKAVSKYRAWEKDPRNIPRPDGEDLILALRYKDDRWVSPAYRTAVQRQQAESRKTKTLVGTLMAP